MNFCLLLMVAACPLFAQVDCPESGPPFGSFDTPLDNSTVYGSIAITGWALDNTGIASLKIYRETISGESGDMVYLGEAFFVEGIRPDVAAQYPDCPNNTSAGWGYMLLTNGLPNQGNGTFCLYAIATDLDDFKVTWGPKTIHADNDNAVKPFGDINAPAQMETISGNYYPVYGWALTPQPNTIPTDGSTIVIYVDGVPLGNVFYNFYRSDIAETYPGYNNSNGAHFYFYLNTILYNDGIHTIYAAVTDDAGNSESIGSRFFYIDNDQTLPVSIRQFSALPGPGVISINWTSESETDNLGYCLERSDEELSEWTVLADYKTHSALKGQGSTPFKTKYQYMDKTAELGNTYCYRLSDISITGEVHVYDVIKIKFTEITIPQKTELEQAYPNPFNPQTKISYTLAKESDVNLSVYSMMGRLVRNLVDETQPAGSWHVYWNGINNEYTLASSGPYLLVFKTENMTRTQKVLLLR